MSCEILSWAVMDVRHLTKCAEVLLNKRVFTTEVGIKRHVHLLRQVLNKTNIWHHFFATLTLAGSERLLLTFKSNNRLMCDTVVTSDELHVGIVSGRLSEWLEAVVEQSQSDDPEIRKLANTIYAKFISLGLSEMFQGYNRRTKSEKTFALVKQC